MEEINAARGLKIMVDPRREGGVTRISFRIKTKERCFLHWGLGRGQGGSWEVPPESSRPAGSSVFAGGALRTPFQVHKDEIGLVISLDTTLPYSFLLFALFFPDDNRWDNNQGKNYRLPLLQPERRIPYPIQRLHDELKGEEIIFEEVHEPSAEGQLAVAVVKNGAVYRVFLFTDISAPLILHWGVAVRNRFEWARPPDSLLPAGSLLFENTAARTSFIFRGEMGRLILEVPEEGAPLGIPFVLHQDDAGNWIKKRGRHFFIPLGTFQQERRFESISIADAADEIVQVEMGGGSWTLMHRFNRCYDLVSRVGDTEEGLALLFVWLRYSALRQLDWQRNYNTKPKELSHAQDRLTLKIGETHAVSPSRNRELLRLILATLGRGGEGQRIRDEILHIMHRHHIKEVSGHFMEEWHQKLHNNTTPDDVVICEAYLEFLRSDGNRDRFYETLKAGGVTRERLRSFERPIVTDPDFVPYLKEALLHDFGNYLRLLKSVHSGADLDTAIHAARYLMDEEMNGLANFLCHRRDDPAASVAEMEEKTVRLRRRVQGILQGERDPGKVRDLLYLDLALEEFSRVVVERRAHAGFSGDQLLDLIPLVLENLRLSHDEEELSFCAGHWRQLIELPRFGQDWSLHAKSVLDRLGRAVSCLIDRFYQLLQPKAEYLGHAFHAEGWVVSLFTEEVVRGLPAFTLSMLLRHLEPLLRKAARLGPWQVVSRGRGSGRVEVVEVLRSVQGRNFSGPTVIIAEKVSGDEEVPEEVTVVITPDATDIVSHVAVRARNAGLLFATCYDPEILRRLKDHQGGYLELRVNPAGDVEITEGGEGTDAPSREKRMSIRKLVRPPFTTYVCSPEEFLEGRVGGKSRNLNGLRGRLPKWIRLPDSVALPFGVCEKVLAQPENHEVAKEVDTLVQGMNKDVSRTCARLREAVRKLVPPKELRQSLYGALQHTGFPNLPKWEEVWRCVTGVWASKWNDRAALSRQTMGLPHEDLVMAVLIQQVVEADYAFVLHTVNPFTGNASEVYAEVVPGLGEVLVGNHPGRALGFTASKATLKPVLLSYPEKSVGLYGGGLIFRSDSNGEDLAGFAGAGLYDSIMASPPTPKRLDYTREPLVWEKGLRNEVLGRIARVGLEVEKIMGGVPQDIEGVYAAGECHVVQTRPQV